MPNLTLPNILPSNVPLTPLKTLSLGSRWLSEADSRLDATAYAAGSLAALDSIERCGLPTLSFHWKTTDHRSVTFGG
jgi:hypothetical protein